MTDLGGPTFGRGHNDFEVDEDACTITKLTASLEEATLMALFPDVFVPVLQARPLKMPFWLVANPYDYNPLHIGLELLSETLWIQLPRTTHRGWKPRLYRHLTAQYNKHKYAIPSDLITRLCVALPACPPDHEVQIHGDATLANILQDPNDSTGQTWRWIDPLERQYIPGDPLVDLGKMFQSCWGYERKLFSPKEELMCNMIHAYDLLSDIGCSHKLESVMHWCFIHMIRLLPYQTRRTKQDFERLLTCISLTSMVPLLTQRKR